jgi:hypothetical protein
MYSLMAPSISQLLGSGPLVNSEKVRWYVGAYFSDLVVRLESESETSCESPCGRCSEGTALVDNRCEMVACSSAKVDRSWPATYVARGDEDAVGEGMPFGGYVMSRTGSCGSNLAVVVSPGARRMVRTLSWSWLSVADGGASCSRRWCPEKSLRSSRAC